MTDKTSTDKRQLLQPSARGAGAVPAEVAPPRLRDIDFTDLLISVNGQALMRGIDTPDNSPLVSIDGIEIDDLDDLRMAAVQKGEIENEFHHDHDGVRYRVSVIRDVDQTWYAFRKAKTDIPHINTLGFPRPVITHLAKLGRRKGLIILAGATGNGKTTTAYSLLSAFLHSFGDIAVTIEDPPEMILNGRVGTAGQCFQLKLEKGETFATMLEKSMRYTPKYILIGEIRRPADASQALRAAISGHLVLTTIHAGNVIEAINSLLTLTARADENVNFARDQLANGLAAVIHQRLITQKVQNKETGKLESRKGLKLEMLFTGDDAGIRSMIREGDTAQLSTFIEQQKSKILQNREPVEFPKG